MYKCVQKVEALAKKHGASVCKMSLDGCDLLVDAPAGYVWESSGCSILCEPAEHYGGMGSWWATACRDMTERMKLGLRKADAEEIKDIEHARDEKWRADKHEPERIEIK